MATYNQGGKLSSLQINSNNIQTLYVNNGGNSTSSNPATVSFKAAIPIANGSTATCTVELPWSYFTYQTRAEIDHAIATTAAKTMESIVKTLAPVQATAVKRKRKDSDKGPSSAKRRKGCCRPRREDEHEYIRLNVHCQEKEWRKEYFWKTAQNLYQCVEDFVEECAMALVCVRLFYGGHLIENGDTAEDVRLSRPGDCAVALLMLFSLISEMGRHWTLTLSEMPEVDCQKVPAFRADTTLRRPWISQVAFTSRKFGNINKSSALHETSRPLLKSLTLKVSMRHTARWAKMKV